MELTKKQADRLIKEAIYLLEKAHQGYYGQAEYGKEIEIDEAICEALEALEISKKEEF